MYIIFIKNGHMGVTKNQNFVLILNLKDNCKKMLKRKHIFKKQIVSRLVFFTTFGFFGTFFHIILSDSKSA